MSLSVNSHHEAGHAVVALELGVEIEFVEADERGGLTRTVDPDPSDFRQRKLHVIISLAGSAAEVEFFGEHSPYSGSSKDFEFARDETRAIAAAMGEHLDDVAFRARLEEARVRAVEIVHRRSTAVAAVAADLITHGHLAGAVVEQTVRDHP